FVGPYGGVSGFVSKDVANNHKSIFPSRILLSIARPARRLRPTRRLFPRTHAHDLRLRHPGAGAETDRETAKFQDAAFPLDHAHRRLAEGLRHRLDVAAFDQR